MNIKKYTGYFHDGNLIDIKHQENEVIFSLESAEIDSSEFIDKYELSPSHTMKGRLLLSNIKKIKVGGEGFEGVLKKTYDDGEILDLKIDDNKVFLLIEWKNFPPKPRTSDISKIEIEAETIQWISENGK